MTFSIHDRKKMLQQLQESELDVLIIGGGITGAGLAVQTAAAKMKTGLLEMQDFAEGTSSRSTKLVHGGIRYLKTFDVEVVADTVGERAVIQGIAPHIPKPDPMILPIYDDEGATTFNMFSVKIAMDLYDRLANVQDTEYANYLLTASEVLEREPLIKKEGLQGAGVYLDYRNNDSRLVIDNIKRAVADGALAVSKIKVTGFLFEGTTIVGVKARDELTGEVIEIHAKYVVNTSGAWADKIRNLNFKRAITPHMRPTKGVHLVVDAKRLPVPQPTYFDTGKQDGRMVFAIPRENKTYFGTTDTDYQGDYEHPEVTQKDVDYLLEVINYRYPDAKITLDDIEASWAGIRPLLSNNSGSDYNGGDNGAISDRSFQRVIDVVEEYKRQEITKGEVERVLNNLEMSREEKHTSPSSVSRGSSLEREEDGLISLSGGKITDYRKMAEGAFKLIQKLLKEEHNQAFTGIDSKHYPISGGDFDPTKVKETVEKLAEAGKEKGLSEEDATYIADFYGTNAKIIFDAIDKIEPFKGLSLAESIRLWYALEEEMTLTPADYIVRRTNHLLFQRETLDDILPGVVNGMAQYYDWSAEETEKQKQALQAVIDESDLKKLKK